MMSHAARLTGEGSTGGRGGAPSGGWPGLDGPPARQHAGCRALSGVLRGALCEQLARRPGRRVVAGEFLYLTGDRAKSLYYLRAGLAKTSRVSPAGEELIVRIHRPGEIFGELCVCAGERREQAMALEPSDVVEILLDDLLAQLRRSPDAALDLVTALCERLGEAYARVQSLSFEPAAERLARTLLMLADTLGEATSDGVHIAHYVRQEELAQMIAARREVVSGLLNRLRERGLIDYSRKGPISVNRAALQAHLDALARHTEK